MLYIPAYWWYTFKFDENTSVSCFKYRTYMNNIAISPKIFMYALQNQNIECKIVKHLDANMDANIETNVQGNVQENIDSNIETNVQGNVQGIMETNIETNVQTKYETNI